MTLSAWTPVFLVTVILGYWIVAAVVLLAPIVTLPFVVDSFVVAGLRRSMEMPIDNTIMRFR